MSIRVSAASKALIQASLPAVGGAGPSLTAAFYKRLFSKHRDLMNVFNVAHQKDGSQPKALFGSIVHAATSALNDGAAMPMPAVLCIAHKHCALGITAEQYAIVGANLLETIQAELNAPQDVLDAWGELYGQVADALIGLEESLYVASEKAGGWRGTRPFRLVRTDAASPNGETKELEFEPVDGTPLPKFNPGQYVSLYASAAQLQGEFRQPRQYSLINRSGPSFRIGVNRVCQGMVSPFLHDAKVGTVVDVSCPYGPVALPTTAKATVCVANGSGITAALGPLAELVDGADGRPVHLLYEAASSDDVAFGSTIGSLVAQGVTADVFVRSGTPQSGQHAGPMELGKIPADVLSTADFLLSGGGEGLKAIHGQLLASSVPSDRVHIELFGSGLNSVA